MIKFKIWRRIKDTVQAVLQKVNEVSKSQLAEYVIQRKVILDVFEKARSMAQNGRYSTEDVIHNIIYPMRTTSADVQYEDQNLWIIDERLTYHRYLASDKRLDQNEIIETDSAKRPDLFIIFDGPFALVDETPPFNSIFLLDFKRPLREDYDEYDNPISQLYRWVEDIRGNKARDKDGQLIPCSDKTRFYCYVLCDLTPKLRQFASRTLLPFPDNQGYFGSSPGLPVYIEIIPYFKLVEDAKKRNRILFDRLNLPYQ